MIDLDIIFNKLMQFEKEHSNEAVYPYFIWNQEPYIPLAEMEEGIIYYGSCRNSSFAVWDGTKFLYVRYKFGYYLDDINHIDNDDLTDCFYPTKKICSINSIS